MHITRTRVISFRLNEEDYQLLKQRSEENGKRKLSDFAREASLEKAGKERKEIKLASLLEKTILLLETKFSNDKGGPS